MAKALTPVEVAYLPQNPTLNNYLSMPKSSPCHRLGQVAQGFRAIQFFLDNAGQPLSSEDQAGLAQNIRLLTDEMDSAHSAIEETTEEIAVPRDLFIEKI